MTKILIDCPTDFIPNKEELLYKYKLIERPNT